LIFDEVTDKNNLAPFFMAHGVYADDGCGYLVYVYATWTEVN